MTHPKIQFISAGAGSGKTYALTQILYNELTSGEVKPGGVLATTFTRKAATELRERVRSHLIRQGATVLANAMGQARIGTVNGICGALLERFAFEAGLPTEQLVMDEARARQLLHQAMDLVMEDASLAALLQVVRRLGLDVPWHGSDEIPWNKALGDLVNDARANAIAPEVLRTFGDINAEECWSSRLGNQHHHAQIFHCKVAYQKMQLVSRWGTSPIVFRPGSWEIIYALTEPFF